jgi:hypothetical protein
MFIHRKVAALPISPGFLQKEFDYLFVHKTQREGTDWAVEPFSALSGKIPPGLDTNPLFDKGHEETTYSLTLAVTPELKQAVGDKILVWTEKSISTHIGQGTYRPELHQMTLNEYDPEALKDESLVSMAFRAGEKTLTAKERKMVLDNLILYQDGLIRMYDGDKDGLFSYAMPRDSAAAQGRLVCIHAGVKGAEVIQKQLAEEGRVAELMEIQNYLRQRDVNRETEVLKMDMGPSRKK